MVKSFTDAAGTESAKTLLADVWVDSAVKVKVACCHVELVVNGTVVLANTVPVEDSRAAVKVAFTSVVGGVGVRYQNEPVYVQPAVTGMPVDKQC